MNRPILTASVALCTYNGERHLPRQLESIAAQTRRVDELVVCDDGSTDATPELLARFAAAAPFPVRVFRNETNLGSTRNFGRAISLCGGDVVLLCDQDDAWEPHKSERFMRAFEVEGGPDLLLCDGRVVDDEMKPVGRTLWESVGFTSAEQARFAAGDALGVLLKHNVATGAAMAFRARFAELVLPIDPRWVHDAWIALLVAGAGSCGLLCEPLISYRQHAAQQVGVRQGTLRDRVARSRGLTAADFSDLADRHAAAAARLEARSARAAAAVLDKADHLRARAAVLAREPGWLRRAAGELRAGRYQRFAQGAKSFARDMWG